MVDDVFEHGCVQFLFPHQVDGIPPAWTALSDFKGW
jgi:hypothetical protein